MLRRILPIFLLLPMSLKSQTFILLVISKDTVIIGADSRAGVITSRTGQTSLHDTAYYREDCKIFHEKNVWYVATGNLNRTIFKYAKTSIERQQEFGDSIEFLQAEATKEMEAQFEKIRIHDNNNYKKYYAKGVIGQLGFIWFNGKIAKAAGVQFKVISNSSEKVRIECKYFPFKFPHDSLIHTLPFGIFDSAKKIYDNNQFWHAKKLTDAVEQLLLIQSKATPDDVGPPFSIVKLAAGNYVKWYRKGKCE